MDYHTRLRFFILFMVRQECYRRKIILSKICGLYEVLISKFSRAMLDWYVCGNPLAKFRVLMYVTILGQKVAVA